ncbi:MAG: hypothetical protein C0475_04480 [Planctomyces sp.]|nr:hypothetical protein [Planctomyces sp.]MBA4120052.1 hypothetical protein [Isosphaera sp.]
MSAGAGQRGGSGGHARVLSGMFVLVAGGSVAVFFWARMRLVGPTPKQAIADPASQVTPQAPPGPGNDAAPTAAPEK